MAQQRGSKKVILDSKRSADFRSVDNAVSRGLSINPSDQISHNQLLEAASRFARVESSDKPWWWIPFNRFQLFREGYFGMTEAISLAGEVPAGFDVIYQTAAWQQYNRIMEIRQICDKGAGLAAFVSSNEFIEAQYLSVRAKLMAADIVYNAHRSPETSLLSDFDIAATVIPYVDVFATENYLAELLRITRVASDYGCEVYTMRQRDEFLAYLLRL